MAFIRAAFSLVILSLALVGCKTEEEKLPTPVPSRWSFDLESQSLRDARAGFETKIIADSLADNPKEIDAPPEGGPFDLVYYDAPMGKMAAYLTPDPKDGKKHPALIWVHGGYGGIGSWFWEPMTKSNEQSAQSIRDAGIVMMVPSFRGENANPGKYEMLYGELDDLEAALVSLAGLSYVDPDRIYLAGHSTGACLALLGAEYVKGFRAAFALGAVPDLDLRLRFSAMPVPPPFDANNSRELELRSFRRFLQSIETPTFYFEGTKVWWPEFNEIEEIARAENIPFHARKIQAGNHFNIIYPTTWMIARKILADHGETVDIDFTEKDIDWIARNVVR